MADIGKDLERLARALGAEIERQRNGFYGDDGGVQFTASGGAFYLPYLVRVVLMELKNVSETMRKPAMDICTKSGLIGYPNEFTESDFLVFEDAYRAMLDSILSQTAEG